MGELAESVEASAHTAARTDRPEVWISLVPPDEVGAAGRAAERRLSDGEQLPLAGVTLAVKDNIDVAGMPTTAGCPAYAYTPERSAPVVAALVHAGAVVIGKTNMDQFATGLVGTRSPYGAVRNAVDLRYVSGGSSSGSAVAVALGQVDLALGTDTAGSGRIPAAFNGIFGVKPTRGLLSTIGTVPACVSLDCVSLFSRRLSIASRALAIGATPVAGDPYQRTAMPMVSRAISRVGVPEPAHLDLSDEQDLLFEAARRRLERIGMVVETIDITDLLEAGALVYGSLTAERYAAVGSFIAAHADDVDPVVYEIIMRGASVPAHQYATDLDRMARLRLQAKEAFSAIDSFMLPAADLHPLIDDVALDPFGINDRLGIYNRFCNPLDLCALTLPAGLTRQGLPWGITLYAPAFADQPLAALAARYVDEPATPMATSDRTAPPDGRQSVVVAGAHLRGQPLNEALVALGGVFSEQTTTAAAYHFYALPTTPPKPALVRAPRNGSSIEVEIWTLSYHGFARLVDATPHPMAIGSITLADGRELPGFVCQPPALEGARDISSYGSWRRYLQA